MIASLRGKPVARTPEGLVLDVGGVGYLVHATPRAHARADGATEVALHTYLAVREDALQLYGFADADERELFVHLLAVNGIGPKVALTIVSGSRPADLRKAILLEDTKRFEAIPGIGKKTAQRVVLELKEKLGGASARRGARPRPARRTSRPRQDEPRLHRPGGARRRHPHRGRAGARAQGRHRRDPHRTRAARRPLRRRDPPAQPCRGGDPLPGARGLPARHRRRPRPRRAHADARPTAV